MNTTEVQVWTGHTQAFSPHLEYLQSLLTKQELERVSRYRTTDSSHPFIVARALLRILLSHYTELAANKIEIAYGKHGKPFIPEPQNPGGLQFNLSHSPDCLSYAFSWNERVGVDVENYQRNVDIQRLADRVFSEKELQHFARLPADRQREHFFRIWSSKEACLKASGSGIAGGMDKLQISWNGATGSGCYVNVVPEAVPACWFLREIPLGSNGICIVATEKRAPQINCFGLGNLL